MKGCILALSTALLAVSIPACPAAERGELEFAIWSDIPSHLVLLNGIAEAYRALHPEVRVAFRSIVPFPSFSREISIRVASRNPPDAGWMQERLAPQFIDSGTLLDVRREADRYDFADFSPQTLTLWKRGGAVFGLPFSTSPFFIAFNTDMFAAAGVPTPLDLMQKGRWTWEGMRDICKAIKEKTGKYAYNFWMYEDSIFALTQVLRAYGADVWSAEGRCGLNSARAVEAMRVLHQMLAIDQSAVPPGRKDDFFSGDVAMASVQLSMIGGLRSSGFSWDVAPLPSGPAGRVGIIGQAAAVVFASGKHTKEATEFVGFLTNRASEERLSEFFPPSRLSVIGSPVFLNANPLLAPEQMKRAVVDSLRIGTVLPFHEQYGRIEPTMRLLFKRLLERDADVKAVARDMCMAVSDALGRR